MAFELDQSAVDLIKECEGFVDHWYPDPAHGWKVPTCCYGHTDAAGEPTYAATKGKQFTRAEGEAILRADLAPVAKTVLSLLTIPVNPYQFGALVSFTYNLGVGNFTDSTLRKKLNAGDFAGAAKEFARWNKAGGKVLKGLTRRRAAEAALFSRVGAPVPADRPKPASGAPTGLWATIIAFLISLLPKRSQ